jgi:hypothetical protein
LSFFVIVALGVGVAAARGDEPKQGAVNRADLGGAVVLETVYIPPGEFLMGSTPAEKRWATGIEGGAQAGTDRESRAAATDASDTILDGPPKSRSVSWRSLSTRPSM